MGTFLHAIEVFFDHLASVAVVPLALALVCHLAKMGCRARAWHNIVSAAYPKSEVRYRDVLGAYAAGVGVNAVVPARGGDLARVFLVKRRIAGATYPTLASTFVVEAIFDIAASIALLTWAIGQGLLPGLDVIPRLPAFDLNWIIHHPLATAAIGVGLLALLAYAGYRASRHVAAFWRRVAQGFAILGNRRLYVRSVVTWQAADWCFRVLGVLFFLQAFGIGVDAGLLAKLENGLTVQVTQSVGSLVPFTPGGVGTEQALVVYAFAGKVSTASLLAFSVGTTVLVAVVNAAIGFGAMLLMLRTLRWRRHMRREQTAPGLAPVRPRPATDAARLTRATTTPSG